MSTPKHEALVVAPHPRPRKVRSKENVTLEVPAGWELLPPGDAGLTRRVKSNGPTWTVKEKKGRRMFSKGVWAPAEIIEACRASVTAERDSPAYRRRQEASRRRRDTKQAAYVVEFEAAISTFLRFHADHQELAQRFASAVAAHATPVGSGTVARTERISVERRAEAAVIAWLRHQTTAYDELRIERVKGQRREVRRQLAETSRRLLDRYRRPGAAPGDCPLRRALAGGKS